jgi:uncharacterized membrane protein YbhN (UPF0104 family)
MRMLNRARALLALARRHPRALRTTEAVVAVLFIGVCVYGVHGVWAQAEPRLADARASDLGYALASVAAYYLIFVVGWIRILRASGIRVGYPIAFQAEMASMLAKYVPGGVWTPAARVAALERLSGATETGPVLVSILLEALLSAVAGAVVFVLSLAWVGDVNAPLLPLLLFVLACIALLHPRIFTPLLRRLLRPFGLTAQEPLPLSTMVGLLGFYSLTWLIGGLGLYFLVRSVGAAPGLATVPFLGGTAAIGAIVAVLAVFSPSGLGVREASMYGLLIAVTSKSEALGATILNRLTITAVEIALFFAGVLVWRLTRGRRESALDASRAGPHDGHDRPAQGETRVAAGELGSTS